MMVCESLSGVSFVMSYSWKNGVREVGMDGMLNSHAKLYPWRILKDMFCREAGDTKHPPSFKQTEGG